MAPHPSTRRLRQLSQQLQPHVAAEDSPPPPLPLTQRGLTITDIKCYGVGTRDNGTPPPLLSHLAPLVLPDRSGQRYSQQMPLTAPTPTPRRDGDGRARPQHLYGESGDRGRPLRLGRERRRRPRGTLPPPYCRTPPSRRSAVAARGGQVAVMGAVQHYREFLIGKDASRIGALWQEM